MSDDDIQVIVPATNMYHSINYHADNDAIIVVPSWSPRSNRHSDTEVEDQGFFESYESWRSKDGIKLKSPRSSSREKSRSTLASKSEADISGGKRLVSQKQFHKKSSFIRARYPARLATQDANGQPFPARGHTQKHKVPSSFSPATRYSREPKLMDGRNRGDKNRPWPKPPKYDPRPKKKNVATECDILKLVQTMDIGTQNVPLQRSTASQATKWMTNSSTQCSRPRRKDRAVQTPTVKTSDLAVQNVPSTKNKFVESRINTVYFPHRMVTEDTAIQCSSSTTSGSEETPRLQILPSTPVPENTIFYEDDFDSDSSTDSEDIPVLSFLPDSSEENKVILRV